LVLAKKSRSIASLGMTTKHFFGSLFSLWGLVRAQSSLLQLKSTG